MTRTKTWHLPLPHRVHHEILSLLTCGDPETDENFKSLRRPKSNWTLKEQAEIKTPRKNNELEKILKDTILLQELEALELVPLKIHREQVVSFSQWKHIFCVRPCRAPWMSSAHCVPTLTAHLSLTIHPSFGIYVKLVNNVHQLNWIFLPFNICYRREMWIS